MELPLSGLRVVEVANYVAVPAAGGLLADLGADVVKVELPRASASASSRSWSTRPQAASRASRPRSASKAAPSARAAPLPPSAPTPARSCAKRG